MVSKLGKHISTKQTNQTSAIPGKKQVQNNAGGYVFQISPWQRLNRFLILGVDGGTYYSTEKALTIENAKCVLECAKIDEDRTYQAIIDICVEARSPKKNAAMLALSVLASNGYTSRLTEAIKKCCWTTFDLSNFVQFANEQRGWGSALKKAVANWYTSKSPQSLAYQVTKYLSRNGYSHRDILRLSHPKATSPEMNEIFSYICNKEKWNRNNEYLLAVEAVKSSTNEKKIIELVNKYSLPREVIPTQFLKSKKIWQCLLPSMKATAMLRNLSNMAEYGLLSDLSDDSKFIASKLSDKQFIQESKIHPFSVLLASGNLRFRNALIQKSVNDAFLNSFANVVPSNKNFYLGLDVSGSMGSAILGSSSISARLASAALALVTMKTEPYCCCYGFSNGMSDLNISASDSLESVIKKISGLPFQGTDCSLPMLHALKSGINNIDCFVIFTDNETWAGRIHPVQALNNYRKATGRNTKLVVVGMTSTGFSIADPQDPGMLDLVGFDSNGPSLISEFVNW